MPIPAGVSRFVLSGSMAGGEIFSTGFWSNTSFPDEGAANSAAATEATNVTTDFATWFEDYCPSDVKLTDVTVYSYPTGGPTATVIGHASVSGVVGASSNFGAQQLCCVATLLTGLSGRRNRGRMYFPATGQGLDAQHQFPPAVPTDLVAALATHLSRFTGGGAVVLSQVAGSAHSITSVRSDTKPDIQRRRVDAMVAEHTFSQAVS